MVSAANKLMEKGLGEFALLNLEALPKSMKSSPAIAFLTAKAAYTAGRYREAQDTMASAFGPLAENPPEGAPAEFVEMAFPRIYFTETTRAAEKNSIDPHLVWAVIRQESRYDACCGVARGRSWTDAGHTSGSGDCEEGRQNTLQSGGGGSQPPTEFDSRDKDPCQEREHFQRKARPGDCLVQRGHQEGA